MIARHYSPEPTPYLKKNWLKLLSSPSPKGAKVVDLGSGTGRNSRFLALQGLNCTTIDADPRVSASHHIHLGREPLPFKDRFADVILANYIFMFLDRGNNRGKDELFQVCNEINRVAKQAARMMIELYVVKNSFITDKGKLRDLYEGLINHFCEASGWRIVSGNTSKFILEKGLD